MLTLSRRSWAFTYAYLHWQRSWRAVNSNPYSKAKYWLAQNPAHVGELVQIGRHWVAVLGETHFSEESEEFESLIYKSLKDDKIAYWTEGCPTRSTALLNKELKDRGISPKQHYYGLESPVSFHVTRLIIDYSTLAKQESDPLWSRWNEVKQAVILHHTYFSGISESFEILQQARSHASEPLKTLMTELDEAITQTSGCCWMEKYRGWSQKLRTKDSDLWVQMFGALALEGLRQLKLPQQALEAAEETMNKGWQNKNHAFFIDYRDRDFAQNFIQDLSSVPAHLPKVLLCGLDHVPGVARHLRSLAKPTFGANRAAIT